MNHWISIPMMNYLKRKSSKAFVQFISSHSATRTISSGYSLKFELDC